MDCVFSDGTKFHVPNTMKMAMDPDGPKYRYEDTNEPKKQHPKISEKYGAKAEWVECTVK